MRDGKNRPRLPSRLSGCVFCPWSLFQVGLGPAPRVHAGLGGEAVRSPHCLWTPHSFCPSLGDPSLPSCVWGMALCHLTGKQALALCQFAEMTLRFLERPGLQTILPTSPPMCPATPLPGMCPQHSCS